MTVDFERDGPRMFGATTPTAEPSPSSPEPDAELLDTAARLFDKTMDKREVRDPADAAARLFDAPIHGDAERSIAQALQEIDLASPEQAAEEAAVYSTLFDKAGLNASESALMAEIGVSAARNPPTADQRLTWVEEARETLRRDYGPRAGQALEDAQRLVAGIPELRDVLHATGLGDHPKIIALAAAKATELRRAGRLR